MALLLLLLLVLVLPLTNCKSSNETVKDDLEDTMYKKEKVGGIETKLKNSKRSWTPRMWRWKTFKSG